MMAVQQQQSSPILQTIDRERERRRWIPIPKRQCIGVLILLLLSASTTAAQTQQQQPTLPHRTLNKQDPAHKNDAHATSYAQRHPNRQYYTTRSNSPYSGEFASYYEDDDAVDDGFPRRYNRHRRHASTSLEDVILCMLTALAWTVWMISSAASSTQAARAAAMGGILSQDEGGMDERFFWRNREKDPLLVLYGNVLQVQQTEEQPIPKYRCVVDYVIVSEHTQESLQIRKQFETSRALEVGFANVELLVLPEDPTHSCLKREYDEQMHNSERLFDDHSECKRLSTAFAAFLVLASLAGTVQVIYLMDAEDRYQGWIVLCVGVTLLLPLAVMIHKIVKMIAAEPGGVIIGRKDVGGMERAACLAPSCMETDLPEVASYVVPEASGCYFVHYAKPAAKDNTTTTATTRCDSEAPYDNVSSASTISSISDNSPNTGRVLWNTGSSDSM